MRPLSVLIVLLYVIIFSVVGGLFIALSLGYLGLEQVTLMLRLIEEQQRVRIICFGTGVGSLVLGIFLSSLVIGRFQRERTIAFSNPAGPVTVSLVALQEQLRRLADALVEVKDLRPEVIATRHGLMVDVKATLWSDAHVPDATKNAQDLIRRTLQHMLGVEEKIVVRVHVVRIAPRLATQATEQANEPVFHTEF